MRGAWFVLDLLRGGTAHVLGVGRGTTFLSYNEHLA